MKTKKIAKFLGLGLTTALAFSLGAGIISSPVSAGSQEWDTITTPSWEDNVIAPGTEIFDYAVGPDGETIYATGAKVSVGLSEPFGQDVQIADMGPEELAGLSGSFIHGDDSGEVTLTKISDNLMEIEAWLRGDTNYLLGDFTFVTMGAGDVDLAAITGTITGDPACYPGDPDDAGDMLELSGYLYSYDGDFDTWPEGTGWIDDFELCVDNFIMYGFMVSEELQEEIDFAGLFTQPRVWKSTDAGVTWTDITADVQDAENLPGPFIALSYGGVAVAPDDEDWVAVSGIILDPDHPEFGMISPAVVASQTGGSFAYAGDVEDTSNGTAMALIYDIAVSPEVDGIHNIALGGLAIPVPAHFPFYGSVFRLEAGTWLTGSWDDTTFYDGWDNGVGLGIDPPLTDAVIACDFSKNFDIDDTILLMGVNGGEGLGIGHPYLQSGTWGSDNSWNDEAGFPEAVEITVDGDSLMTAAALRSLGLAIPADYDGTDPGSRTVFIYADGYNETTDLVGGYVMRVDDGSVSEPFGPSGDPLLASIAFHGDADTGKMMVGERIKWDNAGGWDFEEGPPEGWGPEDADCCEGVRVWHTVEMDPCCPNWEEACKNPSGPYMAVVAYSPDGDKAFATTSGMGDLLWNLIWGIIGPFEEPGPFPDNPLEPGTLLGGLCDESAFSVSLDDGVSFNQIGLIDTDIDRISDMAICPDCSVIYMSSINIDEAHSGWDCEWGVTCAIGAPGLAITEVCSCDSIWRSYDNGDTWERINHGDWIDHDDCGQSDCGGRDGCDDQYYCENILLRLPCEDTEDCCTLYMGVQGTDIIQYSRDCGQCWTQTPGTKILIQDVAVAAENEVMVIDEDGYFSMSTQFGRRWTDEVDTEIGSGHSITSCCLDDLVVVAGGSDEPVAFSEDAGETWTLTDDLLGNSGGTAHVACDPNCPGTIYAAVNAPGGMGGGIFRTTIDDGAWTDLGADPLDYYGIVVARTGGALYAAYARHAASNFDLTADPRNGRGDCYTGWENATGVARNLDPCDTACCGEEDWDYLEAGLTGPNRRFSEEAFGAEPSALRICGCLSMDTPSILWAIDVQGHYDVMEGLEGQIWSYEDCTAKQAPELISPMCGEDISSDDCEDCTNPDINLCWTKICDACFYDIEIATDEDFTQTVYSYYGDFEELDCFSPADCADPCYLIPNGALQAGTTYYWHVRVHGSDTGENARSLWSDTCSFNIMSGVGLSLLAPENGDMGIGIESVGFSWTGVGGATSYSFVLSENSDLSGALASEELSGTAYTYTGMLDYSTPYFWQVTAWKNGSELATSDVGAFTTAGEPEPAPEPPPPPGPAPEIVIPPAEQITPNWIIAVIAIGAALAVLVIVLIIRTRRP